jgi:hypothetical protein
MRMKVVGLDRVCVGVLKVTLANRGHKAFENKFYLYVPTDEVGLWPYGSEVDILIGPALAYPVYPEEGELAPMEHAGESTAEEGERD